MISDPSQETKRILLIEDDPNYRTLVLTTLRKAGMQCTFCIGGDHAMMKLKQEEFDLLIVDYLLPGLNGIEIVRWARNHGIMTPALIITNYPSEELAVSSASLERTVMMAKRAFTPGNMAKIIFEMPYT